MPGVPSSCPKLNFVTAPRAAPKDAANINSRTFLATLLRMLANLRKSPNKSVKLGVLASSVAIFLSFAEPQRPGGVFSALPPT